MVAVDNEPTGVDRMPRAVSKGERRKTPTKRAHGRLVGDAAQRQNRSARGDPGKVCRQVSIAGAHLLRRRLVVRRQAFHRIGDPAIDELLAIGDRRAIAPQRKSEFVQRRVEKDAGVVSGEGPPAGIRAVHSRCQAHNEQARTIVAERRHRPATVIGIPRANVREKRDQPRAADTRRIICGGRRDFWQNGGLAKSV